MCLFWKDKGRPWKGQSLILFASKTFCVTDILCYTVVELNTGAKGKSGEIQRNWVIYQHGSKVQICVKRHRKRIIVVSKKNTALACPYEIFKCTKCVKFLFVLVLLDFRKRTKKRFWKSVGNFLRYEFFCI